MLAKLLHSHPAGDHVDIVFLIEGPGKGLIIVMVGGIAVAATAFCEEITDLLQHTLFMQIVAIETVIAHGLLLAGGFPDEIVAEALHLLLLRHRVHTAPSGGGPGVGLQVMEFSDAVGGVACLLQRLHEGGDLGKQVAGHGKGTDLPGIPARNQRGPGRCADGISSLTGGKMGMGGDAVDIGGHFAPVVFCIASLIVPLLIGHKKKDILTHDSLLELFISKAIITQPFPDDKVIRERQKHSFQFRSSSVSRRISGAIRARSFFRILS